MKRTEIVSKAPWKTVPHRSISRCPLEPKNVSTELLLWRFLLVTCVTGNTSEGQSVWILFLQQIRKFCVHSYNIFISLSTLPPRKMFCITFSHHHFCTMFSEVRWKRSINVNIFFAKKRGKNKKKYRSIPIRHERFVYTLGLIWMQSMLRCNYHYHQYRVNFIRAIYLAHLHRTIRSRRRLIIVAQSWNETSNTIRTVHKIESAK